MQLYNGFGDTLARAFEMAMAPVLFTGLGYLIDRWLGTRPIFLVIFAVLGVVGAVLKAWYAYVASMRAHEEGAPWHRS